MHHPDETTMDGDSDSKIPRLCDEQLG
jgi:hypothetical protein